MQTWSENLKHIQRENISQVHNHLTASVPGKNNLTEHALFIYLFFNKEVRFVSTQ